MKLLLDKINQNLASIADLARQQQVEIDRLTAMLAPRPSTHGFGVVIHFSDRPGYYPDLNQRISVVRGWLSLSPDGSVKASDLDGIRAWKAAGYTVIACAHPSIASSVDDTRIEQWVLRIGGVPDIVEIGNEPDLPQYWPDGNWQQATQRFIVPFAMEMRSRFPHQEMITAALGSIAKQSMYEREYDMSLRSIRGVCVGQAVHPYATTVGDLRTKLQRMRDVYGVPLYATEYDWGRGRTDAEWYDFAKDAVATIRDRTVASAFYRIKDGNPSDAAGRNLYSTDRTLTGYGKAYLDAVANALRAAM